MARGLTAISETNQQLAASVATQIGRLCTAEQLVGIALEIQAMLARATSVGGQNALYPKTLDTVRTRLSLESDEVARAVWMLLASYSDAQDDHKVVVTLTHTLLEALLDDLLVTLLVIAGRAQLEAEQVVEGLRTFAAQAEQFETNSHMALADAMAKTTYPWFFYAWQNVRLKRNRFLHGQPFVIGQKTARQAYKLAEHAVGMFAQLQNTYGLRQPAG